jgi:outer membrane protein TolC
MKHMMITLIALVLLICTGSVAEAAKITLDQAVRKALGENYELKSKLYDVDARRWGLRGAITRFFPRVTFSTAYSKVDEFTNQTQNAPLEFFREFVPDITLIPRESYSSELTVSQPLFKGGSLWANLSAAKNGMKASRYAYLESRLNIILETKYAYFNVLRAEDLLRIQQESVELAEDFYRRAERKLSLGMISNVDALRWKLQLAQNRAGLIDAERNLDLAELAFRRIIGAMLDEKYDLERIPEQDLAEALTSVEDSLGGDADLLTDRMKREAASGSPMLESVHAATAVKRALYRQKYSLFQPSLNFNYSYRWETDDDVAPDGIETWRASVVLSFPIFSSFGDYAGLREARADLKSSEAMERDVERSRMVLVESTIFNLRAALQRVETSRIGRDVARENLDVVENRFDNGLIDNLNLIDAQILHTKAEAEYVSSLYDFLTVRAELDKLLGRERVGL